VSTDENILHPPHFSQKTAPKLTPLQSSPPEIKFVQCRTFYSKNNFSQIFFKTICLIIL
jgi:hypothetical protein